MLKVFQMCNSILMHRTYIHTPLLSNRHKNILKHLYPYPLHSHKFNINNLLKEYFSPKRASLLHTQVKKTLNSLLLILKNS